MSVLSLAIAYRQCVFAASQEEYGRWRDARHDEFDVKTFLGRELFLSRHVCRQRDVAGVVQVQVSVLCVLYLSGIRWNSGVKCACRVGWVDTGTFYAD